MKSRTKLHLWSAGYGALLACLNWSHSVSYARASGLQSERSDGVGAALVLSGIVAGILSIRCLRAAKLRLETGARIEPGRWITDWSTMLYTIPLLFRCTSTSSWIAADGVRATSSGGYGSELSYGVFVLAVVGLLLLQVWSRLRPERVFSPARAQAASPSIP